jgi:hypothetical protein
MKDENLESFIEDLEKSQILYETSEKRSTRNPKIPFLSRWKSKEVLDKKDLINKIKNVENYKLISTKKKNKGLVTYLTFQWIPQWSNHEKLNDVYASLTKWEAYNKGIIPHEYTHFKISLVKGNVQPKQVHSVQNSDNLLLSLL